MLWHLGIVPLATYSLSWIPHLLINPQSRFWQIQREILIFHQKISGNQEVHPYCSRWYSWILMWRPVAYFYQMARKTEEPISAEPLWSRGGREVIYDVHALGNPVLWWLSTGAILLLLLLLTRRFARGGQRKSPLTIDPWIGLYLVVNYAANLLPWMTVNRCTFLYHYMGASVFAQLGLALILDRWLNSRHLLSKVGTIAIIIGIIWAFWFWMPIYLGLPLSYEDYKLRMWFDNWI